MRFGSGWMGLGLTVAVFWTGAALAQGMVVPVQNGMVVDGRLTGGMAGAGGGYPTAFPNAVAWHGYEVLSNPAATSVVYSSVAPLPPMVDQRPVYHMVPLQVIAGPSVVLP